MREKLIARPWQPQDLIDDLQGIIDEECDNYLNTRRTTLCMARDYLKEHFAKDNNVHSKWISATERLPEANGYYLCVVCASAVNQRKEYRRMILFWEDNLWIDMANCFRTKKPLYWMPLPEPPKGE